MRIDAIADLAYSFEMKMLMKPAPAISVLAISGDDGIFAKIFSAISFGDALMDCSFNKPTIAIALLH